MLRAWGNTNGRATFELLAFSHMLIVRYLRYIFFLCGFGYFIDLLYAQAFGLVAPALQNELGFSGQYHQVTDGNLLKLSGRQTLW